MIRPIFTRIPRMPLVGLAVFGLALLGGGASARQAAAGEATPYRVEVTWTQVKWSEFDDGFANFDFEIYGTMQAVNTVTGATGTRMIGDTGNPGRCSSGTWDGSGPCTKRASQGLYYQFADTPLSGNMGSGQTAKNYAFNNHKMYLTIRPWETLRLSLNLLDYDATSGDDPACLFTRSFAFSEAQLKALDWYPQDLTYANSDAACTVDVRLRRL